MGPALQEIIARAGRSARHTARTFAEHLRRLSDFLRDILLPEHSSARPYLLVAVFAAVILGIGGARLLVQADPGSPVATPAGVATSSGGSGLLTPGPATPGSPAAPAGSPTVGPTATPPPTPDLTPASLALRGLIDTAPMADAGLIVGTHEVQLALHPGGGPVAGTFTIGIEQFQIGALLTRTFGGEGDPAFDAFRTCTVTLILVGDATGTWDAARGSLSGTAAFKATTEDVDDCLKTRPPNVTIDPDKVAQPTTRTWRARFDGTTASGTIDLEPVLSFVATSDD